MKKSRSFVYNAFVLLSATLVMRTVGMYFNVYLSNRIGAEAMGVYSLISNVYGFGITLATSGINLATTRLISEAIGSDAPARRRRIMRACFGYALLFSFIATTALLALSGVAASHWLKDVRCQRPLAILALSLPAIALSSCLSGYFTARRQVVRSSMTVFIEQGVRIMMTVILLIRLLPGGIEYACIALALGALVAELTSALLRGIIYLFTVRGDRPPLRTRSAPVLRPLLAISLPVALSSYVRSGLLTLEHALIPTKLRQYGSSAAESLALYGSLHGMAMPVVLFPALFITSFAGLLVPELAEARSHGDDARVTQMIHTTLRLSGMFAVGVCGIMLCFARPLGRLLYPTSPEAGTFIAWMAPLIPVMYLDTMTDVMLKGLGEQLYSMIVNIIDALLSVILVIVLLPRMGIYGYVLVIYICELVNFSLSIGRLISVRRLKPDIVNWIGKPLLAVVGATCLMRLASALCAAELTAVGLGLAILCCVALYLLLLRGLYAFERTDLARLSRLLRSGHQAR